MFLFRPVPFRCADEVSLGGRQNMGLTHSMNSALTPRGGIGRSLAHAHSPARTPLVASFSPPTQKEVEEMLNKEEKKKPEGKVSRKPTEAGATAGGKGAEECAAGGGKGVRGGNPQPQQHPPPPKTKDAPTQPPKQEAKPSDQAPPPGKEQPKNENPPPTQEKLGGGPAPPPEKPGDKGKEEPPKKCDFKPIKTPTDAEIAALNPISGFAVAKGAANPTPTPRRQNCVKFRVFIPYTKPGLPAEPQRLVPLQIKVPEPVTGGDVVQEALKALKSMNDKAPPSEQLIFAKQEEAYELRVAEDDGTPDDGLPALGKTASVQMIFDTLVLCLLDNFNASASSSGSGKSFSASFAALTVGMNPADEVESSASRRIAPQQRLEDLMFRVLFGSQRKKTPMTVNLPPDMLYKDVLPALCEKLHRDPTQHQIRLLFAKNEERENLPDLSDPREKTLTTLSRYYGVSQFVLRRQGGIDDQEDGEDSDGEDVADDNWKKIIPEYEASRYQEWRVVKINKYGSRQDRLLGIDHNKVYNMMPRREKSLWGSIKTPMYPERSTADIASVTQPDTERPCYLEIAYQSQQTPKDRIEARTRREAQEIKKKIEFLIELHHPNAPVMEKKTPQQAAAAAKRGSKFMAGVGSIINALSDVSGERTGTEKKVEDCRE